MGDGLQLNGEASATSACAVIASGATTTIPSTSPVRKLIALGTDATRFGARWTRQRRIPWAQQLLNFSGFRRLVSRFFCFGRLRPIAPVSASTPWACFDFQALDLSSSSTSVAVAANGLWAACPAPGPLLSTAETIGHRPQFVQLEPPLDPRWRARPTAVRAMAQWRLPRLNPVVTNSTC